MPHIRPSPAAAEISAAQAVSAAASATAKTAAAAVATAAAITAAGATAPTAAQEATTGPLAFCGKPYRDNAAQRVAGMLQLALAPPLLLLLTL